MKLKTWGLLAICAIAVTYALLSMSCVGPSYQLMQDQKRVALNVDTFKFLWNLGPAGNAPINRLDAFTFNADGKNWVELKFLITVLGIKQQTHWMYFTQTGDNLVPFKLVGESNVIGEPDINGGITFIGNKIEFKGDTSFIQIASGVKYTYTIYSGSFVLFK